MRFERFIKISLQHCHDAASERYKFAISHHICTIDFFKFDELEVQRVQTENMYIGSHSLGTKLLVGSTRVFRYRIVMPCRPR